MKTSIDENSHYCKYELQEVNTNLVDDTISEVIQINKFFEIEEKSIQIFNNGTEIATPSSLTSLKAEFNDFISTADEDDKFKIVLTFNKKEKSDFKIYSEEAFIKSIPEDIFEQITMWDECLKHTKKINTRTHIVSIENIKHSLSTYRTLPKILSSFYLVPEHIYHLIENIDSTIGDYFKILLSKYCLLALSSSNTIDIENRNSYTFEGYARVVARTSKDIEYIDIHKNIYDVYKLIFIDANFNTRLGLLKNIISVKTSDKLIDIFDPDIIKVLHSNYQIYLRDNIKQYIEVKNKTIELMHNLIIKAMDRFEDQQKAYLKVAAALSMYIFTVIIGRFIFKSDTNVFSLEIGSISILFIVFSMIYLQFSQNDLNLSKTRLITNLDSLKKRYKNIMHKTELDEIFSESELSECFDESNNFLSHLTYQVGLGVLCVVIIIATGINYFYN